MGKLSRSVVGAVILPLAFLPTAAFATSTDTTPSVKVSAPSEEGAPSEEPLSGTLAITPTSGPAGTTIKVSSVTPCKDDAGKVGSIAVAVLVSKAEIDSRGEDAEPTQFKFVDTAADGSWTSSLTAPKTAKNGDVYYVTGACAHTMEDEVEFLDYDPETFTVVQAPAAPVAEPVVDTPTFTG